MIQGAQQDTASAENRPTESARTFRASVERMEAGGTRLALIAKALIVAVMAVYLPFVFAPPALYWPLGFVALFVATGAVQAWLARQPARLITAYTAMVVIDGIALAVVIAVPNPFSGLNLPEQMPFRTSYFALLLVYVVSVGFTYRPGIALAAGASCAVTWAILSLQVSNLPNSIGFGALPAEGFTSADLARLYGNPHFFSGPARYIEILLMTIVGALVAGLVWRSRLQIGRILRAEAGREKARTERAFIRQTFGKYVPEAVASAILSDRGRLTPLKRRATVMFVDIEKFTGFSETLDADGVLTVLNAYFDAAGEVITANGGVINQFQGDAFIASFNVPIPDPDHAKRAVEAAESLFELVGRQHFAGQSVAIRIGLHTGEVAAGAIGSADRLSYTVIGHTVNVAARLEELNKEMGTRLLMTEATLAASGASDAYRQIGDWPLRGMSSPIGVYGR